MNFGENIKKIRTELKLTQEQFAQQLNITRQAVSNWENDRNLPDIEMIIIMSTVFHISLDKLILGETDMNNITEKLVKDGSENRKAKYNMVSLGIGALLLLIGLSLLVIKAFSVEYIDSSGVLHENFFLIPISFLFSFCGFITFFITGVKNIVSVIKNKEERNKNNRIVAICLSSIVVVLFIVALVLLIISNSGI